MKVTKLPRRHQDRRLSSRSGVEAIDLVLLDVMMQASMGMSLPRPSREDTRTVVASHHGHRA
jgi:DNA-binding response OmpR family regulator